MIPQKGDTCGSVGTSGNIGGEAVDNAPKTGGTGEGTYQMDYARGSAHQKDEARGDGGEGAPNMDEAGEAA